MSKQQMRCKIDTYFVVGIAIVHQSNYFLFKPYRRRGMLYFYLQFVSYKMHLNLCGEQAVAVALLQCIETEIAFIYTRCLREQQARIYRHENILSYANTQ